MYFREIKKEDDFAIAKIIRSNLEKYNLNVEGTVYFDKCLDALSEYYGENKGKRKYFVLVDGERVVGGIGLAEFDDIEDCAELQKLYLCDGYKGKGYGKLMVQKIIEVAKETGYKKLYLETHTNLQTAISLYIRTGFKEIERPPFVNHSLMNKFFIMDL